jgi:hypothetical protein
MIPAQLPRQIRVPSLLRVDDPIDRRAMEDRPVRAGLLDVALVVAREGSWGGRNRGSVVDHWGGGGHGEAGRRGEGKWLRKRGCGEETEGVGESTEGPGVGESPNEVDE